MCINQNQSVQISSGDRIRNGSTFRNVVKWRGDAPRKMLRSWLIAVAHWLRRTTRENRRVTVCTSATCAAQWARALPWPRIDTPSHLTLTHTQNHSLIVLLGRRKQGGSAQLAPLVHFHKDSNGQWPQHCHEHTITFRSRCLVRLRFTQQLAQRPAGKTQDSDME